MEAVLPFIAGEALPLWRGPAGRAALDRVLLRLRGCAGVSRALVVTDAPELFAAAARQASGGAAVEVFGAPTPEPGAAAAGALPRGTAWALEVLAAAGRVPAAPLLALDARNPLLTAAELEAALRRFAAGEGPLLLGAVAPADHPCQFTTPVAVSAAGLLPCLEERPEGLAWLSAAWAGSVAVTRPLAYDWEGLPGQDAPAFYAAGPAGRPAPGAVPVTPDPGAPPLGLLWVRLDCGRACLILGPEALGPVLASAFRLPGRLAAVGLPHGGGGEPLLAAWSAPGGGLRLRCRTGEDGPAELKLLPYGPPGQGPFRPLSLALHGPETTAEIAPPPGAAGFVYAVQGFDRAQQFSCQEPFVPERGLWRYDPARGVRVHAATGRPILGRQDFPEVLRLDGSLAVGLAADLLRADELVARGRAAPHLLRREWTFADDRLCIAQLGADDPDAEGRP